MKNLKGESVEIKKQKKINMIRVKENEVLLKIIKNEVVFWNITGWRKFQDKTWDTDRIIFHNIS